jgi:dienelactone hydrolase
VAFAIFGFCWNARIALRIACAASAGGTIDPRASRSLRTARAWSCETRDSLTPISAPICFIVASP